VEGLVDETEGAGLGAAARRFVAGGGFPCFALSLLVFYELFLLAILFAPGGAGGIGAFADEFRVWCFGYDPATDTSSPACSFDADATAAVRLGADRRGAPIRRLSHGRRDLAPVAAAAAIVAAFATGFAPLGTQRYGASALPAEDLRTPFRRRCCGCSTRRTSRSIRALRGKVLPLTAVCVVPAYLSCDLAQAKRAIDAVPPEDVPISASSR
jgi:hypothetical protein